MNCLQADGIIHCLSCHGDYVWCSSCTIKAHTCHPFHRLQKWKGDFYDAISFQDLGFILNLHHDRSPCPFNSIGSSDFIFNQFTVVNSVGIFIHTIKWCRCNGDSIKDRYLQLLQDRLFPSTITKPQTAFTFNVLDEFLIEALECKMSASSFIRSSEELLTMSFLMSCQYV